jgi:hypothetical protein
MTKKYLVIGGPITSQNDGDEHYVNAKRLVELYRVDPRECFMTEEKTFNNDILGVDTSKLIVLRPDYRGNYNIPKES